MKKDINNELQNEENAINKGMVGLEENIQNNKRTRYIAYGITIVGIAVLFIILATTGTI